MKLSILLLSLSSLVFSVVAKNIDDTFKGYSHLNFQVSRGNSFKDASPYNEAKLVKRTDDSGSVTVELENQSTFYSVTLKIGSNEDEVEVLIDTGSSDLWVSASDNIFCESSTSSSSKFRKIQDGDVAREIIGHENYRKILNDKSEVYGILHKNSNSKFRKMDDANALDSILNSRNVADSPKINGPLPSKSENKAVLSGSDSVSSSIATIDCSKYGTFDTSESTTWHSNNTEFFILYGDTTYAYGTWGYDTIKFDNISVTDFSFAVANQSNSSMGVLGIGLEGLETTYTGSLVTNNGYTYANLPAKMVEDGLINRKVYSLWLNDYTESTGSCLFGAVDKAKYNGTLSILPVLKTSGYSEPIKLQITLSSLSVSSSSDSESLIDVSYAALLDSGTTLTYLPSDVISTIATAIGASYSSDYGYYMLDCPSSDEIYFTYNFQGVKIKVPLTDVVLEADSSGKTCALAMLEDDDVILGDSFLRSAYVVYDLDNYQVALAQAVYTTSEDIEIVTSTIPDATTAASYSSSYGASGVSTGATSGDLTEGYLSATALSTRVSSGLSGPNYNIPTYFNVLLTFGGVLLSLIII